MRDAFKSLEQAFSHSDTSLLPPALTLLEQQMKQYLSVLLKRLVENKLPESYEASPFLWVAKLVDCLEKNYVRYEEHILQLRLMRVLHEVLVCCSIYYLAAQSKATAQDKETVRQALIQLQKTLSSHQAFSDSRFEVDCAIEALRLVPEELVDREIVANVLKKALELVDDNPFYVARTLAIDMIDVALWLDKHYKRGWYRGVLQVRLETERALCRLPQLSAVDIEQLLQTLGKIYRKRKEDWHVIVMIQRSLRMLLEQCSTPELNQLLLHGKNVLNHKNKSNPGVYPGLAYFVGISCVPNSSIVAHWSWERSVEGISALVILKDSSHPLAADAQTMLMTLMTQGPQQQRKYCDEIKKTVLYLEALHQGVTPSNLEVASSSATSLESATASPITHEVIVMAEGAKAKSVQSEHIKYQGPSSEFPPGTSQEDIDLLLMLKEDERQHLGEVQESLAKVPHKFTVMSKGAKAETVNHQEIDYKAGTNRIIPIPQTAPKVASLIGKEIEKRTKEIATHPKKHTRRQDKASGTSLSATSSSKSLPSTSNTSATLSLNPK